MLAIKLIMEGFGLGFLLYLVYILLHMCAFKSILARMMFS